MKKIFLLPLLILEFSGVVSGQKLTAGQKDFNKKMTLAASEFVKTLDPAAAKETLLPLDDVIRFDWNYTPRPRKGITFKTMTPPQKNAAMDLLKVVLSADGYMKAGQIIDLENVLRVVESRPANDTYRDPENYAFLVFGNPDQKAWAWRVEGHHLSLHFSSVDGRVTITPGFMGSNPGTVLADVPQKGRSVLKEEQQLAFDLLHALGPEQLKTALLHTKAPNDMLTTNTRKASLDKREGLRLSEMRPEQQAIFKKLILSYLNRYHVTLKNQQWEKLEKEGLDQIYFAWMGDQQPEIGPGHGHYYRIHGPSLLIEFDNTQNGGNHVHSVVRDLDNDFGEDLLRAHYEKAHGK
ncbi:DUF3500 domain-containing protein [Dyadobacter helix]|nr:DUF3500 domain-containing protein [Dyadobacter sp. CECT 9275]